jgi:hypothetical protein
VIPLTTPFTYNPANGNLLLDVRNFSGGTTTVFDAQNTTADPVSRVYTFAGGVNSATADVVSTIGLVAQFTLEPVTAVKRDGTITKTMSPPSGIRVGDTVTFTVTITLPTAHDNVVVQDVFAGAGKAPDTAFVGPATLTGTPTAPPTPNPVPVLARNVDNWVQYTFTLGNLAAGTYTLTYQWKISPKLGCYTQANNSAHLDYAGVSGHVDTHRIAFQIRGC